jgi:hypothetical protein
LPRGCYFFLDKKVTKKSSQQECFFAAQGLRCTTDKKPWAAIFLPRFAHTPSATCKKLLCPARPHNLAGFLSVSPEAYLLTKRLHVNF